MRYQVNFALQMTSATAMNNYEYLDILDRAFIAGGLLPPAGKIVCDVGCASFWYAHALQAFFNPRELIGIEVEGHRLFKDGRTRIDYALGYLTDLPNARFIVEDYVRCRTQADVITAWFPFVSPAAILAWRLPLSMLQPERVFKCVCHNLNAGGLFVMVNHGPAEAGRAAALCVAAGLRCSATLREPGVLSGHRMSPAHVSIWHP
jgi:hypothetical protein